MKPYETIIVNDSSTDQSREIAEYYADNYDFTIIDNDVNKGIGFTRARGAKTATGDYVAFLSSDDAYHPLFIELMQRETNGHALFSDYLRCDEKLKPTMGFLAPRYKTQNDFRRLCIQWCKLSNMFVNFSTVVIPRHVFEHINFKPALSFGEDLVFLIESLNFGLEWKNVNLPLVYYRVHDASGTSTQWDIERRKTMWRYLKPHLIGLGIKKSECHKAETRAVRRLRRGAFTKFIPQRMKTAIKKVII